MKLTAQTIKCLITSNEPFEGVVDDDCTGLALRWSKDVDGHPALQCPRRRHY